MRFESSTAELIAALTRSRRRAVRRALRPTVAPCSICWSTHAIDALGAGRVFITDYPADQAALARLVRTPTGRSVAARFELIIDGVEVANGYDELADADVMERE